MNDKKNTLLIVDDSAENVELIVNIFKESYNILVADSGAEALKLMTSEGVNIDVVLLDLIMDNMGGYKVLETMAGDDKLKFLPVVVITANDDDELEQRALELGAIDFISKPFNVKTMKIRIENVLRQLELQAVRAENEQLKKEAESEMHLSALMDNLPGGVAIIKTDGKRAACTYYNNAVPKLFHMKSKEFLGIFDAPKPPEWLKSFISKAKKGGKLSYSFSVGTDKERKFDNSDDDEPKQWISVSASGIGRTNGWFIMYCVFLDINAEKQQEYLARSVSSRLRDNELRIENMMNNVPGGLALCEEDENGSLRVMYCSKGMADIMSCRDYDRYLFELMEEPTSMTVNPDEVSEFKRNLNVAAVTGNQVEQVFTCKDFNGNTIWLSMRGQLMRDEKGKMTLYCFVNDITKEKTYEQELTANALYDSLTGLYNRSAFMRNAKRMLEANPDAVYEVIRINIGGFKLINDIMGRDTGDKVLSVMADIIRDIIPENGIYARFFADDFSIMIPNGEIEPEIILGTIKREIEQKKLMPHEIQCYAGIYVISDRDTSIESACDRANMACRSITGSFKQYVAYYDDRMRKEMLDEQEICDEAHRAIENNEFCIYYQSVYGIRAKKFVSAEALVRWKHPTKGLISPGRFIPIFEKNGFIAELDIYVLEQVCKYQKKRRDQGLDPFPISVNISRMSLYNPKLFDIIDNMTKKYGIDPACFRIEITESAYNDNPAQLLDTVKKLREKHYPVLMDDFGSGYSSLNTLKDIPVDVLKLDMKFMQDFEKNNRVGTIVTSVARMSKWLNVPMLAEGVETKEQYDFLESIGCSYIQGFLFAKPSCEEDFTNIISSSNVITPDYSIENYGIDDSISELLGNSSLVSKLIGSVFGGLGIYEMVGGRLEVIRVNEGYMQIMGYTPEDFMGEHFNIWEKMPADDVDKSRNACLEAMRTGKAVKATVRRYNRAGDIIYLEGIHRRLGGSDEAPIFCIAFNDITNQLRNDRILKQSKGQISEILDATGAIVIDVDAVSGNVFCSGDTKDFGFTIDELTNMITSESGLSDLIHPEHRSEMLKYHKLKNSKRVSKEFLIKDAHNSYRWVRFTKKCSCDGNGRLLRIMGIINDIDAEKRAEEAFEEAKLQMDYALDNVNAGIVILELDSKNIKSRIKISNKGFWNIIGKEADPDFEFIDLIRSGVSKKQLNAIGSKTDRGEDNHFVFRIIQNNGNTAWLELTCTPMNHSAGDVSEHMIILTDITERYVNANKLEAIVNNFNGGLALLSRKKGITTLSYANEKFAQILNMGETSAEEMEKIFNNIISYRYGSFDMELRTKNGRRIVKSHAVQFDNGIRGEESYVVSAEDVTVKRQEAINRIAERSAYASTGIYNEVYKIDYRDKTSVMVANRQGKEAVKKSKPHTLEEVFSGWVENKVHPDDHVKMTELITAPMVNADFTDSYTQIRVLDPYHPGEQKYLHLGMAMVKAGTDSCMLFVKDLDRADDSHTSAEIAETSRLYKMVAEQTNTTVIEFDHIINKVTASPSIKQFSGGFTEDQLKNSQVHSLGPIVHPDDLKQYQEFMQRLSHASEPKKIILRLKMADDSYKWCRMTVSLNKGADGKVIKSLCTINIVHAEIEAQHKAKEVDDLMKRTIRNIPVGIGIYKLTGSYPVPLYVSDNTKSIFGYGKSGNAEIDPSIAGKFMQNNKLLPDTEEDYIQECRRPDGSTFWINSRYVVRKENGEIIIYSVLDDVTEKVKAQHAESVKDQMYQMLLNEVGTIIFYYDTEKDELTYHRPTKTGENDHTVIDGLITNIDKLTLFGKEDRSNFIEVLIEMSGSTEEKTEELIVCLDTGKGIRHFRCFFKSICGERNRVSRIIGKIDDINDEVTKLEAIKAKAMYDSLCVNIYNKATTEELIRTKLRGAHSGALIMIDVDDFKSINDSLGHMFGDEFLKTFGTVVKGEFRDSDVVGRYGGDEFCVFISGVTGAVAKKKCEALLEKITEIKVPKLGSVKSSMGVAAVTEENTEYRQLLKQADSALYAAKNRGKNQVVIFDSDSMTEGSYRTTETAERSDGQNIVLSSNPESFSSLIMRVFSLLNNNMDINKGIEQMLMMVGTAFDVSRAYIFEDNEDGTCCNNTFEWCGEGVEPEIGKLQNVSYEKDLGGNYHDNFNDDWVFYCHDIKRLSKEQRDVLEPQGIKSMLQCAIMDDGRFKGYIGFDECRSNRFWTQEQIDALVFISRVVSVFLTKERNKGNMPNLPVDAK